MSDNFTALSWVEEKARDSCIRWLVEKNPPQSRIANFGCFVGKETLALVWALHASEAVGIDKNGQRIRQGQDLLASIKRELKSMWHGAGESRPQWVLWKTKYPDSVKGLVSDQIPSPPGQKLQSTSVDFIERDMARRIGSLESNYFDLAYCESVLYQILDGQDEDAVQSAIHEMARVVRSSGWIVAVEPVSSDGQVLDFSRFFRQAGLIQVTRESTTELPQDLQGYVYRKP